MQGPHSPNPKLDKGFFFFFGGIFHGEKEKLGDGVCALTWDSWDILMVHMETKEKILNGDLLF